MCTINADTPDTLEVNHSRIKNTKVDGEEKETRVNNKIITTPHIKEGKESNEVELSATIVVLSTYA